MHLPPSDAKLNVVVFMQTWLVAQPLASKIEHWQHEPYRSTAFEVVVLALANRKVCPSLSPTVLKHLVSGLMRSTGASKKIALGC